MIDFTPRAVAKESAAEVRAKLRSDLSRWSRVRRAASIKPMIGCIACDATGHLECESCGGTGKSKVVLDEKREDCVHCDGKGQITCVDCAGAGEVPNAHRKAILWVLGVGALAWFIVLWSLIGHDVLPEQRAKYLAGGGGGGVMAGRGGSPQTNQAPTTPATGPESPSYNAAPQGRSSPTPVLPQRNYGRSGSPASPGASTGPDAVGPGFGTPALRGR